MLINGLSPENKDRLAELVKPYVTEYKEVEQEYRAAKGEEDKQKFRMRLDALNTVIQQISIKVYQEQEEEEFAQIKGGAKGILKHAKKLLPQLIKSITTNIIDAAICGGAIVRNQGTDKEELFISKSYALNFIKEDLRLHINALKDNEEALQDLFLLINQSVNECTMIIDVRENEADSESLQADPQALDTFRRMPLANIKKIGLMSDKASVSMIQATSETNGLMGGLLNADADGQLRIYWSVEEGKKGKEQVSIMASLSLSPELADLKRKLTGYDLVVFNAISDLFANWIKDHPKEDFKFTVADVWRRMNGKQPNSKAKPSKPTERKIEQIIEKMLIMRLRLVVKEELEAGFLKIDDDRLVEGALEDYFINCSSVTFKTSKGMILKGYSIPASRMPLFYKYNLAKGNIRSIPFELLDTSDALSDSEYVRELTFYLVRQIDYFKHQDNEIKERRKKTRVNEENKIRLETIYKDAGIPTPEERATASKATSKDAKETYIRKCRNADIKKIDSILTSFKMKNYIKNFKPLNADNMPAQKGQAIRSYTIDL